MNTDLLDSRAKQVRRRINECETAADAAFSRYLREGDPEALRGFERAHSRREAARVALERIQKRAEAAEEKGERASSGWQEGTGMHHRPTKEEREEQREAVASYNSHLEALGRAWMKEEGGGNLGPPSIKALRRWCERTGRVFPEAPSHMRR